MKKLRFLLAAPVLCVLLFQSASALVNDSDTLYVGPGETFQPTNEENYYKVSITVKSGGTIAVQRANGTTLFGKLDLVAPRILLEGKINANACGNDTRGQGGAPTAFYNGGGGGAFGGAGGKGDGGYAGPGGAVYDTSYLENPGSLGYGATGGNGFGGGSIRLDALSVTLAATAQVWAQGNTTAVKTVGGGSGGCILVNSPNLNLVSGYALNVSGGPGGASKSTLGAAGGGGSGRIKIFEYNLATMVAGQLNGGAAGGGTAQAGSNGAIQYVLTVPVPNAPILILPGNGQVVGQQPTFMFYATDPGNSKFLSYQIDFSQVSSFSPLTFTVDQRQQDPGWGGKLYLSSGEVASYTLPSALQSSTVYYWRVRATNNQGGSWSANSTPQALTTTAISNPPPMPPVGFQPAAGQTLVGKTPVFQVEGADPEGNTLTFAVVLSTDPLLQNAQMFQATYGGWNQAQYVPAADYAGVSATCQVLNGGANLDALIPGEDYYWRVVAYDALQQSAQSPIYHFSTVPLPEPPAVVAPLPGALVTTRQPQLQMTAQSPTGGSLAYKIELSSDAFQTELLFASQSGGWSKATYASGETAAMLVPASYPLLPGTVYQWRGSVYDVANDNWSLVSASEAFTVMTPPLLPVLTFPDDNYSAPNANLVFRFSAQSESGSTLTARFEISADNFQSVLARFDQNQATAGWSAPYYASGAEMQFVLPAAVVLKRGQTYWWHVQATDGISWGPMSSGRSFSLTNSLDITHVLAVPNPAVSTSDLQIQVFLTSDAEVTVRIFNKLGKPIHEVQQAIAGGTLGVVHCDLTQYASGVYFYRVEATSGLGTKSVTKKFAVVK